MSVSTQRTVVDIPEWMQDMYTGRDFTLDGKEVSFPGILPAAFAATQTAATMFVSDQVVPILQSLNKEELEAAGITKEQLDAAIDTAARNHGGDPNAVLQSLQLSGLNIDNLPDVAKQNLFRGTPERAFAGLDRSGVAPLVAGARQSLDEGIGAWSQFMGSGQDAFNLAMQSLGAGTDSFTRSQAATAQFPGAYGQLASASGIAGLTQGQLQGALGTADAGLTGAQDYLTQQNIMLREMPASVRDQLTGAATRFENTLLDLSDTALADAGTSRNQVQDALRQAGGDTTRALQALQAQGIQLDRLPVDARNRLLTAAQSQSNQIRELDNQALQQANVTQNQLQDALRQAGGDTNRALQALQAQGVQLDRLPADVRNRLTQAAQSQAAQMRNLDNQALQQAGVTQNQLQDALRQAGGDTNRALQALQAQGVQLDRLPADVRNRLTQAAQSQAAQLRSLEQGAFGQTDFAQQQAQEAIARGRSIAGTAADRLLGAGGMYDPSMTQDFMDPYRRDVVEAQQREMQRLADIQRQDIRAQAVGAGAFGGSREAVQQAELTRNLMDQQSRIAAELMSQGYSEAQANSMAAFEAAQQRQLQGASGAGQIGLSAEQLAAQTGLQGGQMGLQALQQAMQNAQFLAQQGMSAEQIAAQTGLSAQQIQQAGITAGGQLGQSMGQLGMQGATAGSQMAQQAVNQAMQAAQFLAQQGMSAEEIASRTGLSAAQLEQAGVNMYGQMGLQLGQLGMQGAQTSLQQADLMRQMGLGIGALGAQEAEIFRQSGLGQIAGAEQMAGIGGRQLQAADVFSTLGGRDVSQQLGMGEFMRGVAQQEHDTTFENQMREWAAPMQEMQWLSDITRGTPSGQTSITQVSQPQQGWGTQLVGLGVSALGMGGFGSGGGGWFGGS